MLQVKTPNRSKEYSIPPAVESPGSTALAATDRMEREENREARETRQSFWRWLIN